MSNDNMMLERAPMPVYGAPSTGQDTAVGQVYVPPTRRRSLRIFWSKRCVDVLAASVLILFLLPVYIALALLIKRAGGPVVYRHTRVGRGGRPFHCLKFCTMAPNGDEVLKALLARDPNALAEWTRERKLRNDPRVTPLGRVLRKTSLDELPQLFNVLQGDMSLVGPRPIVRDELVFYGRAANRYMSVRPGITGLWQVSGRNDTTYERRVALDSYYVRKMSARLDAFILFKTAHVVFNCRGAH